jgi:hypothetical protein
VNARDRARRLVEHGHIDEAREAYLQIVARDPDNVDALTDLGTLLVKSGYREAARTTYERALALAPERAVGHANLANILFALGDYEPARERYAAALARDPQLVAAHQGLSYALTRLGRDAEAQHHRRLGFAGRALTTAPYYGNAPPVELLLLVSAAGGTIYTDEILDDRVFRVTTLVADAYAGEPIPPHDVVFNAIGDAERCRAELAVARDITAAGTAAVVNDPERVLATTRVANAERLGRLEGVVTAATAGIPRAEATAPQLEARGFTFPLLLRAPGFHTGRHFVRVERAADLAGAAAALPGDELLAIAFLDLRDARGMVRKYRMMYVDGEAYPLHVAIAADWKVHYFTAGMAENATHRDEEGRFLADPGGVLGAGATAALERVRAAVGLDYFGIDFGLDQDGRIVVFEANATMIVLPPGPEPIWDYRRPHAARVIAAVQAMLVRRARGEDGIKHHAS